jgi:glycosyltransferase involved in cell wall biosynthesis
MLLMPRATVIMATYNWSTVLPYSIGSALRQTFTDFELLVVGDGCTDASERVVAAIGDPRVRWINLPANSGHQSAPNNEGLRQARGEIIAYLGHDDLWLPHHLELLVSALDEQHAGVAHALMANVGPEGRFIWPAIPRPQDGSFASPSCMSHRRAVTEEIGGWRDYRAMKLTPDVELWQRAQAAGHHFAFVPRLTGLKFPAGWRRRVYQERPSHEQAAWLRRIESEPDFEARLLVRLVVDDQVPTGLTYRDLSRHFVRETVSRIRRRFTLPWSRGRTIDDLRRFKGLPEKEQ